MKNYLLKTILFFIISTTYSQYINVNDQYTANELVTIFLGGATCGSVSNVSINGGNNFGTSSIGYFDRNNTSFPLQNGIILSTGKVINAIGPNTGNVSDGSTSWQGDNDLMQALGINNTFNASVLEFDYIPFTNKISFDYIFASEQYLSNPSSNQCGYTDGFAFLIKPNNSNQNYQNIALVPGTNTPVTVQTIRGEGTICPKSNEQYFDRFNPFNSPITFNGQTKILKAESSVIAGNSYHIKLVIADQGNEKYDSAIFLGGGSFQSEIFLGDHHTIASKNPYCSGDIIELDATQYGTKNTYTWYKNNVNTGVHTAKYTIIDNTNTNEVEYRVEVMLNGVCLSKGSTKVQFSNLPNLTPQNLIECDFNKDGKGFYDLTKLNQTLTHNDPNLKIVFSEKSNGTPITDLNYYLSSPKTIFAKVSNTYCSNETTINLQLSGITPTNKVYTKCDEDDKKDGFTNFILNQELLPVILPNTTNYPEISFYKNINDAEKKTLPLANNFTNTIRDEQKIYARIDQNNICDNLIEITLKVNYINSDTIENKNLIICKGETLKIEAPTNYTGYLWNTLATSSHIIINQKGIYTVELTNSEGCKATKKYVVQESAPATDINAVITDFSNSNSLEISYTSNGGEYEFSVDGIQYQNSNFFTNLEQGEYQISVRDKNGCEPTPHQTVYILDYPKFFTPNNDGYNDTWYIKDSKFKKVIEEIEIFDRYGKLLKQLTPNQSWDGTYLGISVPSDDYWFTIKLYNNKSIKNHFSLKR
ncbi:choice-of-anchor L domain-containing protein [Flavobacterium oreochromis]|uniref:Choice-of-anchor L domain-containing protein n=1 Tax=Flavobacterium oreochromis TaxID=2906078 RepID=A0ABW8PAK9_9FLAO|nr:choice-of-anchor L domain-containing protein [Flavobacterium oreochromis]OWP78341.1 hypothetical protein BWG23_02395 [Flavobacterium oreochromis]POR23957.1 hypothetical protein BWK58_09420 [Flavobacterium columnare]QYS86143.1 T9SS type B sorting domain-containing protein [Flavobacterium oreochromis]